MTTKKIPLLDLLRSHAKHVNLKRMSDIALTTYDPKFDIKLDPIAVGLDDYYSNDWVVWPVHSLLQSIFGTAVAPTIAQLEALADFYRVLGPERFEDRTRELVDVQGLFMNSENYSPARKANLLVFWHQCNPALYKPKRDERSAT